MSAEASPSMVDALLVVFDDWDSSFGWLGVSFMSGIEENDAVGVPS